MTAALFTNQKATQYTLGAVPGGLPLARIFIVEASLAFLKLYGKVVIKGYDGILDLFSRRVIGYRVSENASTQLVTATFKTAFAQRGYPKNLTFHSDRGKQYTSKAFTKLLHLNGVTQSFSASGSPHDNAVAESFFSTFKKKRCTVESTPQKELLGKVWMISSASTTRPVRTWL